ncbi:MAG: hypothetical protein ACI4TS_04800, partial [Bacteroidaceae bacterium]
FVFLGKAFANGGELGNAILWSLIVTGITGVLLWFLIKAKGAENHLETWKKIEYSVLGVYILVCIPLSFFGGINCFFAVAGDRDEIKSVALNDLDNIKKTIRDYKEKQEGKIASLKTKLYDFPSNFVRTSDAELFLTNKLKCTNLERENIDTYCDETLYHNFRLSDDPNYFSDIEDRIKEIKQTVSNWNWIKSTLLANKIEKLSEDTYTRLNDICEENQQAIPIINYDYNRYQMDITGYDESKISKAETNFKEKVQDTNQVGFLSVLITLLIHLIILLNYIVAYRTSTLSLSKNTNDSGTPLT